MQGIKPDVLDWQDRLGGGAFFAPPGRLTHLDPVGGLVARAAMSGRLDKGFHEHGAVAVTRLPVVGQLPRNEREDFRGQAFGLDPGQNQETGIVGFRGKIERKTGLG